jgi:hypothetical protein
MVFAAVGSILGVITGFWLNPSASIDELTVFVAAPLVFAYVLLRFLVVVSSRIPDAPEGAPVPPMPAMFVMVLTLIFASALGSVIVGALSMEAYHLLDVEWAYIAARVFIADCGWVAAVCAVLLCIHLICRDLLPVLDRALSSSSICDCHLIGTTTNQRNQTGVSLCEICSFAPSAPPSRNQRTSPLLGLRREVPASP